MTTRPINERIDRMMSKWNNAVSAHRDSTLKYFLQLNDEEPGDFTKSFLIFNYNRVICDAIEYIEVQYEPSKP